MALLITTTDSEGFIDIIDDSLFTKWFYNLSARLSGRPEYATVRQNYLYLDRKTGASYTMQYHTFNVDKAFGSWVSANLAEVSAQVSDFPRIVKSILANWAASDILRMELGQGEKGREVKTMGDEFYQALKERYDRLKARDMAFLSLKMLRHGWNYRQRIAKPIITWGD